jgi:hypothetical protein
MSLAQRDHCRPHPLPSWRPTPALIKVELSSDAI